MPSQPFWLDQGKQVLIPQKQVSFAVIKLLSQVEHVAVYMTITHTF